MLGCRISSVGVYLNIFIYVLMILNAYISILQAMYERQGVAVVPPTVPSGPLLGIQKGTMKRQKSIGKQDTMRFY